MKIENVKSESHLGAAIVEAFKGTRFTLEVRGTPKGFDLKKVRLTSKKQYCGNHPNECVLTHDTHRNTRFLEGADWVEFNDTLNNILDKLNASADIYSKPLEIKDKLFVRKGFERRINYDSKMVGRFFVWDGSGTESDYENFCNKIAPKSTFPEGTPGVYGDYNCVG